MKKYFVLSFLFLLAITPALAKGSADTQSQPVSSGQTVTNTQKVVSPTGNAVQNQNQVQTQNQGEEQQLSVKTQESEQLNQDVNQSLTKVSDQVHQLIDTVGAKGGIGQEVKAIAQDQLKVQDQIKSDFEGLNSRGTLKKLLIGSDKKLTQSLEQKMEQNRLMIQQLEELKLQIRNTGDLQQLQETIDLMVYQNTSLQNKIDIENKAKGIFGWLVNLFN
ncbi:MAG: hypothetical protein US68_C0003G0005 [Candidatus Shapirobacteria bacterium GW2011_GWE1_38_10]|uniref:Uncharacterized protein n=1 Tax=Candidatus Shapirobacteria bacterium GW2011_GWE1_38_10 TaxID=1618488 RepID=A0A0G0KN96_9BACT|nr:MAG: hypothetical protein US46_C0012G0012 [Candidatus Shapirobacteria bacterium GW2011_GWF2_37_20]KKQ50639.1 MAG: hypothetical protein US68_C0003G0005 [Candidatus Shapirobacteria bacterium GW2011_GWE1_38_10]KKQ62610.1 MAG: hypothetical protein US85_C0024G0009 [Candidatus Shapirobacteria bacterium GW2011_GWF1_38_23]HBP51450.1 hypothetical protein [Candidatus Shapirobacteria bacterium]